jgi:hypothetical protein
VVAVLLLSTAQPGAVGAGLVIILLWLPPAIKLRILGGRLLGIQVAQALT